VVCRRARSGIAVTIGGLKLEFDPADPSIGLAIEQLASAIEAAIASGRARRMIVASSQLVG
jgi:hypothetical protein